MSLDASNCDAFIFSVFLSFFCWWGGVGGGVTWRLTGGQTVFNQPFYFHHIWSQNRGPEIPSPSSAAATSSAELCKKATFNKHSAHKRAALFRHVPDIFPLFSFLHTTPPDKTPPQQVSSYQVAPTFCNKSIPSNPKLQLNFLNTELVKPGIRQARRGGGKVLFLQPAGLGAGICGDVVGAY